MKFSTFTNFFLATFAIAAPTVASLADKHAAKEQLLVAFMSHTYFDDVPEQISNLTVVEEVLKDMGTVIMTIFDEAPRLVANGNITEEKVQEFLSGFENGELDKRSWDGVIKFGKAVLKAVCEDLLGRVMNGLMNSDCGKSKA
ncbi:hypothetical protein METBISCDRAFT_22816 [Metschnikowia bicuspidata]|uniref:Uncharacterized protein n=1 Tax=Metschnikowia bicuspidata TaxID=27322 RepID=A0A4P9ZFE1_9ASCO|nr:hypothetical protein METBISCDRAFT_22816 [Metschnikowia bicuspidata]